MAIPNSADDPIAVPSHVLSMTDEEGDIMEFRSYLRTLPPEALWDIVAHIDAEKYPLRVQTAQREIAQRRLFFISPYTAFEVRLRAVFSVCVGLAVLLAALRAIGSVDVNLEPGEHLCWFFDIAVGGPPAARMVLPLVYILANLGAAASIGGLLAAGLAYLRHKLRSDVLVMGVVSLVLIFGLLRIAAAR